MKSEIIAVTSEGGGISQALEMTEKTGVYCGLEKKSMLHLRLLAEELIGMLRGIAGEVEAEYWIEAEGGNFELHMRSDISMTDEMRNQFIAAATSGKNEAAKSFMGKIKVMIADVLLSAKEALPYAMANSVSVYPTSGMNGEASSVWSLAMYRNMVQKHAGDGGEAYEAWDELEKSIVANVADDVKVSIIGKNVEITVYKKF